MGKKNPGPKRGQRGVNMGTVYCECTKISTENPTRYCMCMSAMNWVGSKPAKFICDDCSSGKHQMTT